jgi:hypothetical protein
MKWFRTAIAAAVLYATAPGALAGGGAPWFEDFDSYGTGQNMHGTGGWQGWDNDAGATAFTTDDQFLSGPNSLDVAGPTDIVQTFTSVTDGAWFLRTMVFVPSSMQDTSWFILLNSFTHGDPTGRNWSSQVQFDGVAGTVNDADGGGTSTPVPLITDEWVELLFEIDLNNDTFEASYNGTPFVSGPWSQGGQTSIEAIDLFADGAPSVFYDDMSLTAVPAPAALALFGLAAGFGSRRRRA